MSDTVAEVLVDRLGALGVKQVFGIPGDAINALVDALRLSETTDFVTVRHEEAGAFAASAQAKFTGRIAVCAGTAGPGAVHLLNGLYDAKKDRAPVLAVTGQVPTLEIGTDYHQEVDLAALFSDVSVYNQTIMNADDAPRIIAEACHLAQTRRGVAHISLPLDIAEKKVADADYSIPLIESHTVPSEASLDAAAKLLNGCKKIAILAGIGCKDAVSELKAVADRLEAPIIHALRGKEILAFSDERNIGGLGLLGGKPGLEAVEECDGLLLAGTNFPYRDFLPKDKPVVQIDIDAGNIGRRCVVSVGLCGDAGATLQGLLGRLRDKRDPGFFQSMCAHRDDWNEWLEEREGAASDPIAPGYVARLAGDLAKDDALFTCDTGEVTVWAARHLRLRGMQRFTLSSSLASMAFAMPAAIGASFAYPGRQVVALCGDGGFSMLMADFLTAVRWKLPLTAIIFNNRKLGLIEVEQESDAFPHFATELDNPDFAAFATLCGGRGLRVEKPGDLKSAITEAFSAGGPTVIDVLIDPDALPMPPSVSLDQAYHFGIAKMKEAFAGFMGHKK